MRNLTRNLVAGLLAVFVTAVAGFAEAREGAKVAVAAFGLWSDPVFRSEAEGAARVVAARFGRNGPVVVVSNSATRFGAGPAGIAAGLARASRGLDPDGDVLFVVLTSHGGPEGIAERGGGQEGVLSPAAVAALLARSPVRHKVLVVSACYSGVFTSLAGPDTLVITAADADHSSFGCVPEARWTYFGDAFFNRALRQSLPLDQAFAVARTIVTERETREGFTPSNPQMAGGEDVLPRLRRSEGR